MPQISYSSTTSNQPRDSKKARRPSRDDRMLQGTRRLLKRNNLESLGVPDGDAENVTIKNYNSVTSYSWKDVEHPTIYVPGISCKEK